MEQAVLNPTLPSVNLNQNTYRITSFSFSPSSIEVYVPFNFTFTANITISSTIIKEGQAEIVTRNVTVNSVEELNTTLGYTAIRLNSTNNVKTSALPIRATQSGNVSGLEGFLFTVTDFSNNEYYIQENENSFVAHLGSPLNSDFLNHYSLIRKAWNDYKTIYYTVEKSLSIDKFDIKYFTNVNDYTYTTQNGVFTIAKPTNVIGFGENKFSNLYRPTKWTNGTTIKPNEIYDLLNEGILTYTDDYVITVKELPITKITKSFSLGTDSAYNVNDETPNPMRVNYLVETEIGNFDLSYDIEIEGQYEDIVRAEFENAPTHLDASIHTLSLNAFNNYTIIKFYNSQNQVVKTITNNKLNEYIKTYPEGYNQPISNDLMQDRNISLTFGVVLGSTLSISVVWNFVVDYYEPKLTVSSGLVNKQYYIGGSYGETVNFDFTNLVVSTKYHKNSEELGKVIENNITNYVWQADPVNVETGTKTYPITFLKTIGFQTLVSNPKDLIITVTRYEIVGIQANGTDTTKYYDNDADHFHIPTGVSLKWLYSDNTTQNITDLSGIRFYLTIPTDDRLDTYLTTNASDSNYDLSIVTTKYSKIYVYDIATRQYSFYLISFEADSVSNVYLDSNVNFVLGNRFNSFKPMMKVIVAYGSGTTKEIQDYEFVNDDYVLTTPTAVSIKYLGNTYNLDISKFTFITPNISSVYFDISHFPINYNNNADSIDCNNLNVIVNYENSAYEQELSFSSTITSNLSKFYVTSVDMEGYSFNGTETINVDMGNSAEKQVTLDIHFTNAFGGSETRQLNINVIEITDITGISLSNVKTEYNVGDRFLDENDTTIITIFYNTSSGTKTLRTKLNAGLSGLNIFPLKNTKFTRVESGKVVKVSAANNHNVSAEYTINVSSRYVYSDTKEHDLVAVKLDDTYYLVERLDKNGDPNTRIEDGVRKLAIGKTRLDVEIFGYLADIFDDTKNARVVLYKDYIPLIEGSNNITVKYPCYVKENAEYINNTHFGIMFGSNNTKNRLFVSGNKGYCNYDWHSGELSDESVIDETTLNGNLAYFEDDSWCAYGETDNSVVGYSIVSNDKLLVLKDHSDKETTVYFRQPTLINAIDGGGNTVTGIEGEALYQEAYTTVRGNNSNAAISNKAIANLNGDTLFVDYDNKVLGLDLTGIIGDNQRYANSRSYFIDKDLAKRDLSNCLLWTNNKYLFLTTPDRVYVTHYDTKGDSQYEWFVLDIKDISSMFEMNKTLFFGNSNGELYRIGEKYIDKEKVFVGKGSSLLATLGEDENIVTISKSKMEELKETIGDDLTPTIKFKVIASNDLDSSYMYYQVATISNSSTGTYDFLVTKVENEFYLELVGSVNSKQNKERYDYLHELLGDEKVVYLNHLSNESEVATTDSKLKTPYIKYFLKEMQMNSSGKTLYKLFDENDEEVSVEKLFRAAICYKLDESYDVINIDYDDCTFQLELDGQIIDLVAYADQKTSRSFAIEISVDKNVEAYYITKPYDMGGLNYLKTIWSWTMTNDTQLPSKVEIAYCNNKIPLDKMKTLSLINQDKLYLDFDDMFFKAIDFDKTIVPRTYTNNRVLSNIKFMCFGFRNNEDSNAVLSSLNVTYTLPFPSYKGD